MINLKFLTQYSKCIFHHSPGSGKNIIEDAFLTVPFALRSWVRFQQVSFQRKCLATHNHIITWGAKHNVPGSCSPSGRPRWVSKYFPSFECAKIPPSLFLPYDPSYFLLLKRLWTHKRFFLSLRAAFFSSSSNINAIVAICLLKNKLGCTFDENNHRPPITCCSWMWLNTTDSVNTDHSDGTKMERWRNGNVTQSVNRPFFFHYIMNMASRGSYVIAYIYGTSA